MKTPTEKDVTFTIETRIELHPVRGNALDSGDAEEDRRAENAIIDRLARGEIWAWTTVKVTAVLTLPDGTTVEGYDFLGSCSYKDEEDFKSSGYYDDMKSAALADLTRTIKGE